MDDIPHDPKNNYYLSYYHLHLDILIFKRIGHYLAYILNGEASLKTWAIYVYTRMVNQIVILYGLYQSLNLFSFGFLLYRTCLSMYLVYEDINAKYLATYAKIMDTNPLIKNLHPIMVNPAPSSLISRVFPIQMQVIPNAIIIIPAIRRGLKSILELVEEFI
jgi:hypothetical protein